MFKRERDEGNEIQVFFNIEDDYRISLRKIALASLIFAAKYGDPPRDAQIKKNTHT